MLFRITSWLRLGQLKFSPFLFVSSSLFTLPSSFFLLLTPFSVRSLNISFLLDLDCWTYLVDRIVVNGAIYPPQWISRLTISSVSRIRPGKLTGSGDILMWDHIIQMNRSVFLYPTTLASPLWLVWWPLYSSCSSSRNLRGDEADVE